MRLIVVERTERTGRVAAWGFDLEHIGSSAGQEFATELAFLVGQFENFHIEEESRHLLVLSVCF
jgi:hypothetical protein